MVTVEYDDSIGKLVVRSDEAVTKAQLEFRRKETKWCPWTKSFREEEVINKIYDNPRRIGPIAGVWRFEIGKGWAAFLAQMFKGKIDSESYKNILRIILADSYRTLPFSGLRDYQNEDVLHLLKYKIGLASLNTGYGNIFAIIKQIR